MFIHLNDLFFLKQREEKNCKNFFSYKNAAIFIIILFIVAGVTL